MKHRPADEEDLRGIVSAAKIIHDCIKKNNLEFAYVMEVFQSLYASYAYDLVSYEEYCEKMDFHKQDYKRLWNQ